MLNMFTRIETALTQRHILTRHALIHCTPLLDLLQLTAITIIIIAHSNFLTIDTFFQLILFHLNNPQILLTLDITT